MTWRQATPQCLVFPSSWSLFSPINQVGRYPLRPPEEGGRTKCMIFDALATAVATFREILVSLVCLIVVDAVLGTLDRDHLALAYWVVLAFQGLIGMVGSNQLHFASATGYDYDYVESMAPLLVATFGVTMMMAIFFSLGHVTDVLDGWANSMKV